MVRVALAAILFLFKAYDDHKGVARGIAKKGNYSMKGRARKQNAFPVNPDQAHLAQRIQSKENSANLIKGELVRTNDISVSAI